MQITLKLYATLSDRLPSGSVRNASTIDVEEGITLNTVIDRYNVPRELAHLVLINGIYKSHTERDVPGHLKPGDVLAIWPPVAGG